MNTKKSLLSLCAASLLAWAVPAAEAAPPWWEGATEDVPAAAAQTGKPVVLYFTSPNAAECVRMEEETFEPMNPLWADLQFHWLKLEPRKDADFFKYWQINQVPQVVVLDPQMKDQLRLRGFMSLDRLKESLERIERTFPSRFTTVNGSTVPAANPVLDTHAISRDPHKGHIYFENFNSYRLIGSISNPPFSPIAQGDSRIDTSGGTDRSSALVVDAGDTGRSLIQIDISQRFADIEQVLGRIRVRAQLKAISPLGSVPVDVLALYVMRTDEAGDGQEQMFFASLSDEDRNRWKSKEIVSSPINFRLNKAFILLNAQKPKTRFLVDDLTVDLLPPDDLTPYVDIDAQVRTIAAIGESTDGGGDEPDDFYERLSNRAKVRAPTSVSNNVSQPAAEGKSDGPTIQSSRQEMMPDQIEEMARYLAGLDQRERLNAVQENKLHKRKDYGRIMIRMNQIIQAGQ